MLTIKSNALKKGIKFPTSVDEITAESLNEITAGIKLPKHYAIIAICFRTKIFDFVTLMKNPKNTDVYVIPIMAKISDEDAETINTKVGDKLIIDRSTIERGVHINIPTIISSNNARNFFTSDQELSKAILTKKTTGYDVDIETIEPIVQGISPSIFVIEFKIVPINDISASIPINNKIVDPFIINDYMN